VIERDRVGDTIRLDGRLADDGGGAEHGILSGRSRYERAAPPGKTSQNKKYLCASGSTVAGSQTSNSPSAVTR
jgi:hypothetical protein